AGPTRKAKRDAILLEAIRNLADTTQTRGPAERSCASGSEPGTELDKTILLPLQLATNIHNSILPEHHTDNAPHFSFPKMPFTLFFSQPYSTADRQNLGNRERY
ncbi:hypothetical protein MCOR03_002870, partial [Pyricularia oryzae]